MKKYLIASLVALLLIAAFLVFRSELTQATASSTNNAATFAAIRATDYAHKITPTPTLKPVTAWKTIKTFASTHAITTPRFIVPTQWRATWRCIGFSDGMDSAFGLVPYSAPDRIVGTIATDTCSGKSLTIGHIDEIGGGTLWLAINAVGGGWTVNIQVPA